MSESIKSKALLGLLKNFAPDIQDKAAPVVEEFMSDIIKGAETELLLGEDHAAIDIVKMYGKVYIRVVMMSEHHQILRTLESRTVEELVNMIMQKVFNTK